MGNVSEYKQKKKATHRVASYWQCCGKQMGLGRNPQTL